MTVWNKAGCAEPISCGIIHSMEFLFRTRALGRKVQDASASVSPSSGEEAASPLLKTVGWVSAGVGALALGVVVGREIRQRYKFNRRTPYDFYAHSGDNHEMDFGIGI